MNFAEVGVAAIQLDGPFGGRRNTTRGDEQSLYFNLRNPEALRDNVRQGAVELSILARTLDILSFDAFAAGCPGVSPGRQRFDLGHLALFGHSSGAASAILAAAIEPLFGAAVLSGSAGSYLEHLLWKKRPANLQQATEKLLGYTATGRKLTSADPALSLLQWATESADPQVYARGLSRASLAGTPPPHLLLFQGIVDHYILPPLLQSVAIPLAVDLAGPVLDQGAAELAGFSPLADALGLAGRGRVDLPASGNQGEGAITAVIVQHPEDGIDDGHEVVFQSEAPKHQYRCFLQSWQSGVPQVAAAGALRDPCP